MQNKKPILDETAMNKLEGGTCGHYAKFVRTLAENARKSNAGSASVRFSFVSDAESIDGEYVPEIIVRVRVPDNGE